MENHENLGFANQNPGFGWRENLQENLVVEGKNYGFLWIFP